MDPVLPPSPAKQRGLATRARAVIRPALVGLLLFGGLELLLARPQAIWWVLFLLLGFTLVLLLSHGSRTWKNQRDRHVVILALTLTASSITFILFPEGVLVQHTAAAILSIAISFLIWFLRQPVQKNGSPVRYTPPEGYVLLTAFLVLTDVAGLSLFFSQQIPPAWNLGLMLVVLALTAVGLGYQFFVFQDIPKERIPVHLLLLGFVMAQVAWGLSFWPTDVFSRGAVLFVVFYVFAGLAKHAVRRSFTWRIFGEYAATSTAMLALVLSTARWTF